MSSVAVRTDPPEIPPGRSAWPTLARVRWLSFVVMLASVPGVAHALDCERDDALSRAAATLLGQDGPLSPGSITRAVRAEGSDAPAVHALRDPDVEDARVRAWLEELHSRDDAPLACGEAQGDAGRLVLAAARAGTLSVDGDPPRVRGHLAAGFVRPELVVRDARGRLERVGVDEATLAEGVRLSDELALPAVVQLVADGPHGPRPVAERVVGGAATGEPTMMAGDSDPTTRLDDLRELREVGPVRHNRLLAREATRHARRVCEEGRVAHTLEPGEDPEHRLERRGIRARLVGEVVARAASPGAAMDALVRSPSHHLTLVERRFTDAGLGTATDAGGHTCLVILLAAWPQYLGAGAAHPVR